ncbi:hypothetical protein J2X98_004005 [Pseudarthrobacter enclensis]|jgi:hypothetical protein|uniref:Uncharacterized protein n=1 Tax=Pseudarthrobacter enclensis TaxID=993070 RepID=A0ABT9RYQ8_9MICC|nr:hypothetical protein [Pseudarthrobacter enclensis]
MFRYLNLTPLGTPDGVPEALRQVPKDEKTHIEFPSF